MDPGPLLITCSMEPMVRVLWEIQIDFGIGHIISRSSYDLDEVITDIECKVDRCLAGIQTLKGK